MAETGNGDKPHAAQVSRNAEQAQANNQPDPFPPEGTDDKALNGPGGDRPLSEEERVKAVNAALHRKP